MIQLVLCVLLSISTVTLGVNNISPDAVGEATKTVHAPWMVSLQLKEGDFAYCGASIIKIDSISNTTCSGWIVTAASCLEGVNDVKTIIATIGKLNLDKENKKGTRCTIVDTHSHEKYNETTNENDIGLIQVHFGLPTKNSCEDDFIPVLRYWPEHDLNETDYPRINASVYGWGLRQEIGLLQKDLYNTSLPLKTDKECTDDYGIDIFNPMSMICAGGQGQGPCSYDTGGPLTCKYKQDSEDGQGQTDHEYLCGIASFGNGCGPSSYPSIFTDVVNFKAWINEKIDPPKPST